MPCHTQAIVDLRCSDETCGLLSCRRFWQAWEPVQVLAGGVPAGRDGDCCGERIRSRGGCDISSGLGPASHVGGNHGLLARSLDSMAQLGP